MAQLEADKWQNCVIGFFLKDKLTFMVVKKFTEKIWITFGLVSVTSIGQGMFLIRFKDKDKAFKVIKERPRHYFLIQKWTTNLPMVINNVKKVVVWIKFYEIPLEFWTSKGLSVIASAIRRLLYANSVTKEGIRLKFARLCVEISVESSYPEFIKIKLSNGDMLKIKLEYIWKLSKCKKSYCFGHITDEYVLIKEKEKEKVLKIEEG